MSAMRGYCVNNPKMVNKIWSREIFFANTSIIIIIIIIIVVVTFWGFFTPALAEGPSLDFERQQVSSVLQDLS